MPVAHGVIHLQFIIPVYAAVIKSCDRFHEHVMFVPTLGLAPFITLRRTRSFLYTHMQVRTYRHAT